MTAAVATTELMAVNEMLTAVGTTPVNTLSVSGLTDAAIAFDTLVAVSKEVQSKGWWFNTNIAAQYTPAANVITVPANVLSIRPTFGTYAIAPETVQFALRDNKLYNLETNANVAVSVRADVVKEIEFENLPESARRYITVRAARIFQTKVLGDETQGVFTERHEAEAWSNLEGDDAVGAPQSSLYMRRVRAVASQYRPDPIITQQSQGRRQ